MGFQFYVQSWGTMLEPTWFGMGFLLEVDDKGTCRCVLWLILGHGGSGGVVEVLWVFFFFFDGGGLGGLFGFFFFFFGGGLWMWWWLFWPVVLVYFNGFCGGLLMMVVVVGVVLFWDFLPWVVATTVAIVVADGGCFGFFCGGLWLPRWC